MKENQHSSFDDLGKECIAKVKMIRSSPRKLNLVLGLIRGMKASDAMVQLRFMKKKVATDVLACLNSAIANAENNLQMDIDNLIIHRALSGKALVMKRFRPRARGRGAPIKKPFSNLTIVLKEIDGDK